MQLVIDDRYDWIALDRISFNLVAITAFIIDSVARCVECLLFK